MSEQIEISKADLLREWIEKKISENYDYSKLSYKKNDVKEFMKANPEFKSTESQVMSYHRKILKEVAEQKGKSPSEIGIKKPKVNQSMLNNSSDMNAIIEPKPRAEIIQPGMPNQVQMPGQPGTAQPNQPYVNPNMTVESISAMAKGSVYAIKSFFPEFEALSDEEGT